MAADELHVDTMCSLACGCRPLLASFLADPNSVSQFHCCISQLGKDRLGVYRCTMCMCMSVAHSPHDVCRGGGVFNVGGSSLRSRGSRLSHPFVYGRNAFLNPTHIFCCCFCCMPVEVLVDGALAVFCPREEAGWLVSPGKRCPVGVCCGRAL